MSRNFIDANQIRDICKQGNSDVIQLAGSGMKTTGHGLVYDANGNAVDGGTPAGTVTNSGTLTADQPVFGAGTTVVKVGTKTGNTDEVVTATGPNTSGQFLSYDSNGNAIATVLPAPVTGTYVDNETPSGSINSSNVTFTLAQTPNPSTSLRLFLNGILQLPGTDFTLSTATITFTSAPTTGAWLLAFYQTATAGGSYVDDVTPTGTINGSNTAFTLPSSPGPAGSLRLYLNGILQLQGTDYTLSGTAITYTNAPSSGALHWAFYRTDSMSNSETPSGTINGSNVTFTLANTPNPSASLDLYLNGVEQDDGVDYTLSGATITFVNAPSTGSWLLAFYRK